MSRLLLAGVVALGWVSFVPAQEAETPKEEAQKKEAPSLKQAVIDNPDDVTGLRNYLVQQLNALNSLSQTDPDAAEKQLKELQEFLTTLKPKDAAAKRLLVSGKAAFASVEDKIVMARLTMEDITKALEKNPDDVASVRHYIGKLAAEIRPIARKEPDKAEKLMTEGQDYLKALSEKAKEDATKTAIESAIRSLGSFSRTIETAKKHLALVGTDAAKLEIEAWVNGEPLTEEDLKGKVVLLDFWAVWCGPCIATFPHLIEWDKKYDDLVIIGVTNYYNYAWDAKAKRASRSKDDVAHEVEQDMLVEFAKQHKLTHRFALQAEGKSLSAHYIATAIPTAVVIDKQGKIRLIRVGSGEANAQELEAMIEKLIAE